MSRYRGYGQACPLAKAAEVLCDRWTLLVIREVMLGSTRFSQFRRGIPMVSPTMLSQRLRELEAAGIIRRRVPAKGKSEKSVEYELTPAGQDLGPLVGQLTGWGHRWALARLRKEDLEPTYLMWVAHKTVRTDALGSERVVIAYELLDAAATKRYWWLVIEGKQVDLCFRHPGFEVDLTVRTRLRPFALLSLGKLSPQAAVRSGDVTFDGKAGLVRSFPSWYPRTFEFVAA
jgi:DNA-binding HxlR family transcriptional regulator